jgi:integrase
MGDRRQPASDQSGDQRATAVGALEAAALPLANRVELLVDAMPAQYKALVLVGAYAGLRWGEAAGLTRASIDVLQSRIRVTATAVEVRGHVSLGNEPKTARSKRTVPIARSVMRRLEEHLMTYVGHEADALVFTAP